MTIKGTVLRSVVRSNHMVDKAGAQVADLGQNIAKSNIWESVAKGAHKYRGPLIAGTAAVGATYVAGTAIMGRNQQRTLEARAASQEQGQQR